MLAEKDSKYVCELYITKAVSKNMCRIHACVCVCVFVKYISINKSKKTDQDNSYKSYLWIELQIFIFFFVALQIFHILGFCSQLISPGISSIGIAPLSDHYHLQYYLIPSNISSPCILNYKMKLDFSLVNFSCIDLSDLF